jgi:hypothetical protein
MAHPVSCIVVATLACLSSGVASAELYKCVDGGKTTYQGTPCTGPGSTVSVEPATKVSPPPPPPASANKSPSPEPTPFAKAKEHVLAMELERRQREIEYEVEELESRILRYQADMERELALLRHKKDYAANNLAGATYEQSISGEMQVVADRYRVNIEVARDRMAELRKEAAELRKAR